MIYKMKNGIIPQNDTLPERLFENQLLFNNTLYVKQYKYAKGIADFWLPESNIIVEVDGIYWHSKPEVNKRDIRQTEYLESQGFTVFRFTDIEIRQDMTSCIDKLLQ